MCVVPPIFPEKEAHLLCIVKSIGKDRGENMFHYSQLKYPLNHGRVSKKNKIDHISFLSNLNKDSDLSEIADIGHWSNQLYIVDKG